MADASNAQVLHKTVIESTDDFTNGEGATSQALNAIDQVRRCAGDVCLIWMDFLGPWMVVREEVRGQVPLLKQGEVPGDGKEWMGKDEQTGES